MAGRLAGKVVIITGGTRGMGEAEVRGVVAEGGKVVFGGRDEEAGAAIAADLGGNGVYLRQDVTSEEDWKRVVQTTLDRFGQVNGLVNNAGLSMGHKLQNITLEQIHAVTGVNQIGVMLGMREVIAPMRAAGGGSIVNIGSPAGTRAMPNLAAYSATKAAVVGMSRSAAAELAAEHIRVNVVHPGYFATRLLDEASRGHGRTMGAELTPMKRVAEPQEIVGAIVYLLSDEASFVTGAELAVDGGLTM